MIRPMMTCRGISAAVVYDLAGPVEEAHSPTCGGTWADLERAPNGCYLAWDVLPCCFVLGTLPFLSPAYVLVADALCH
jgi:hypothetical protein